MTRSVVEYNNKMIVTADDDPLPGNLRWWAILRARVIDELTERPPRASVRVSSRTPHCRPHVGEGGLCGLVARPVDVSTALANPARLTATIEVDGFLPLVLDDAIDAARRQLPIGAADGTSTLVIDPPDSVTREQFIPGRGLVIERASAIEDEQFTEHAYPLLVPPPGEVPIIDVVHPGRNPNSHVTGVPIVLGDQALHVAEPVRIRGRAHRQVFAGTAPVPAPGTRIGVAGLWWFFREIPVNSAPPHQTHLVSFNAPLAFGHVGLTPARLCNLAPDGIVRNLAAFAQAKTRVVSIHPWNGLNPAGGDVLQLEADNSNERELVVTAGFDALINPAIPAQIRLRTPLTFPHQANIPAVNASVTDEPLMVPPRALERQAIPGDCVLFLNSVDLLTTEHVLHIAAATPQEELRFARCLPTYDGVNFAHEVALASDGAFQLPPIARVAQLRLHVEHGYNPLALESPPQPLNIDFAPDYRGDNPLTILITP